jgi:L,D-transpeptidase YcbB
MIFRSLAALLLAVATPLLAETLDTQVALLSPGARVAGDRLANPAYVRAIYTANGNRALWSDAARFASLQKAIAASFDEGLTPADYHATALARLPAGVEREFLATDALMLLASHLRFGKVDARGFDPEWNYGATRRAMTTPNPAVVAKLLQIETAPNVTATLATLAPSQPLYSALRTQLARYRAIAAKGGWAPVGAGPKLAQGDRAPRVGLLAKRLAATGDLTAPRADADAFDAPLKAAVAGFQTRNGLTPDGTVGPGTLAALDVPVSTRIDQMRITLDRARVVMADLPDRFVVVNVAAFEVYLQDDNKTVWRARAMVGKPYRKTPVFRSDIDHLVFNPTWTVPPTILRQDIAPAARRDPNSVTRKGLQVIDRNGKVVSPRSVNWSGSIPYTLRQPGGPKNALGRVKFMFPNAYAVYLHDTPSKGLFANDARALSSGCVRVERPFELAERLLAPQDPSWTAAKIDATVESLQTVTARLARPVPVLLSYWTAWVGSDGAVNFRKDVYSRDPQWLKALNAPMG